MASSRLERICLGDLTIKKKEFIEGIKLFVDNLNKGKGEIVLEIISISDIDT